VIAREPHPVGSPENARVRDYLVRQISAMGLRPEVQKTTVFWADPDEAGKATNVENILVRIEGTQPSQAVLITAHYDSVPSAPGAGDNGMAVAAMLETLRALKASPPPRNDLIFLFNDGEELGMFGSTAFLEQHPWAKDVGVVFDFDRSDATGAALFSWTAAHDGWLVREIADASPGILAASTDNASKRQDYNNDLHAFAAAGLTGAHFDNNSGSTRYHTLRDRVTNTDPRSLQHEGNAMLALARHFGDLPIGETKAEDEVFFTVFGGKILHYPLAWALPLAVLAGLGAALVIALGVWWGRLSVRRLAGTLAVLGIGMLAAGAAATLAWLAILAAHPEAEALSERDFYGQSFYTGALYALTVALALALWSWIGRRLEAVHLAVAALGWLAALALLLAAALPHGSYLATWPALVGALALGVLFGAPQEDTGPWWAGTTFAALLLSAVVALAVFLVPALYLGTVEMEEGPALWIVVLVLGLGLLAPQLSLVARAVRRRWLPATATLMATLVGAGLIVAGNVASGYDAGRPRPDTLFYVLNADTGEATWATLDPELDEWTRQFLSGDTEEGTVEELLGGELFGGDESTMALASAAPVAPLKPPELVLLGEEANGTTHTLQLHLSSPRRAWRAYLLPGPGVRILAVGEKGGLLQKLGEEPFTFSGLPPEGVDLTVKVRASGPVRFTVVDQTNGLPQIPGVTLPSRPKTVMPAPQPEQFRGYPTFVRKSFVFGEGQTP
ncbi:MAG TPA: M20/M25/M40 family metallo-hydrolase, partial [Rubrobacteraceae bacterium]|nr:M20/M25/M40 family metallo-hydrolase [Rubrobacteraceae bacterium]